MTNNEVVFLLALFEKGELVLRNLNKISFLHPNWTVKTDAFIGLVERTLPRISAAGFFHVGKPLVTTVRLN